jgi:hypothetical protein
MQPAIASTFAGGEQFTPERASQYMSPYMQNVVDIQKREASRQADVRENVIGDQAVQAGSFGGSRQAILEAEHSRNTQQLLDDIQRKGSQSAYETGLAGFEQQKQRDLATGRQFTGLAEQAPRLAMSELGALQGVGKQKQEQAQSALDIGYQQFKEEEQYPEQVLQEYSSVIRGFPLTSNQFTNTQRAAPAPDLATQIAGAAGAGIAGLKAFNKGGGLVRLKAGGGLASLPEGGPVYKAPVVKPPTLRDQLLGPDADLIGLQKQIREKLERDKATQLENKKSSKSDKNLALMEGFLKMMALGGQGKSILSAVGEAGAGVVPNLRDIRSREREELAAYNNADLEAAKSLYSLSKDQKATKFKLYEKEEARGLKKLEGKNAMDVARLRTKASKEIARLDRALSKAQGDERISLERQKYGHQIIIDETNMQHQEMMGDIAYIKGLGEEEQRKELKIINDRKLDIMDRDSLTKEKKVINDIKNANNLDSTSMLHLSSIVDAQLNVGSGALMVHHGKVLMAGMEAYGATTGTEETKLKAAMEAISRNITRVKKKRRQMKAIPDPTGAPAGG